MSTATPPPTALDPSPLPLESSDYLECCTADVTDANGLQRLEQASESSSYDMPRRRFHGDVAAITLYLDGGGDIDRLFNGFGLLHWACSWSDIELVKLLLARRANTELVAEPTGKTALLQAVVSQQSKELVRLLLSHSASLEARDSKGCTALMHTCAQGKSSGSEQWRETGMQVMEMLMAAGADFRAKDPDKYTALCFAWPNLCHCEGQDGSAAIRLIAAGADIEERGPDDGRTLLLHAAARGSPRLVQKCLDAGAQVSFDIVDDMGKNIIQLMFLGCNSTRGEYIAGGVDLVDLMVNWCDGHHDVFKLLSTKLSSKPLLELGFNPEVPSKSAPSTTGSVSGFAVGEAVWAAGDLCSTDETKSMLVYSGAPGKVLSQSTGSEHLVRVLFEQAADGSGQRTLRIESADLTRNKPSPRGNLLVGSSCWAARDLFIEANELTSASDTNARGVQRGHRVPALTRGTVIGLPFKSPKSVAVQFDVRDLGANLTAAKALKRASQMRVTACVAEVTVLEKINACFPDVCSTRAGADETHAEWQAAKRERVERALREREKAFEQLERARLAMEEGRRREREAEEDMRRREEEKHAEIIMQAKLVARQKKEEESAVAKARAKAEAEAREAARKAAEAAQRIDDGDLGPAIHEATTERNVKALRQLLRRVDALALKKRKAIRRWSNGNGETPLYLAALEGHADAVALLLDAHFSIDQQLNVASVGFEGATPLYAACERGHAHVARLLLQRGADPTRRSSPGGASSIASYSEVARQNGHEDVAELLQRAEAEEAAKAETPSPPPEAVAPPQPQPPSRAAASSSSMRRFQPALNAITEDGNDDEEEDEELAGDGEPQEVGESVVLEDDLEDIDDGLSPSESLVEWQRRLEDATTATELRAAIEAIVRTAKLTSTAAEALAPMLPQARDRLDALQVEAATSLNALGCALPSDVISSGMLSAEASSSSRAFVTGHTILVVDGSGSMRNADVINAEGERVTRASAVLGLLTQNFVRTQIDAGVVPSERVSLIKVQGAVAMRALPFALFPLDHGLSDRIAVSLGEPSSHGPYLPALGLLAKLVELSAPYLLPRAKTNVLFLSDGRPSDRVDARELPKRLREALAKVHAAFATTHTFLEGFQLLGFGEADEGILKMMATMVPGNVATFNVGSGATSYRALEQSVSTFSSSVAVSRISSVSHTGGSKRRTLRAIQTSIHQRFARYRWVAIRCR